MKKYLLILFLMLTTLSVYSEEVQVIKRYNIGPFPVTISRKTNNTQQNVEVTTNRVDNSKYVQYLNNAVNKDLSVAKRIDSCNAIRNLSDSAPFTKAQLYALKIVARYKICDLWMQVRDYSDDLSSQKYALAELSKEGNFYVRKTVGMQSNMDKATNEFFLGLYEYSTGNPSIGEQKIFKSLNYMNSIPSTKSKAKLLKQIYNLTVLICKDTDANILLNEVKSIDYTE